MVDVPKRVYELLQKKSMIGPDKPMHEILVVDGTDRSVFDPNDQAVGSDPKSTSYRPLKAIQGYGASSNNRISNWVRANNGKHFCAWTENIGGVNRVVIGYTSKENNYFLYNYPCEDILITDIAASMLSAGQVSLFKRTDGKVLMFVLDNNNPDMSAPTPRVGAKVDCYISNNGNGTDFAFHSNVYTNYHNDPRGYQQLLNSAPISMAIQTKTGRLVITFIAAYYVNWIWSSLNSMFIYTSDDEGVSWTRRLLTWTYNHTYRVGQPVELPDGTLFVERQDSTALNYVYRSLNNATNWVNVTPENSQQFRFNFSDYNKGASWPGALFSGSFFYDARTDTAYRVVPGAYNGCGVYALYNPTNENFLDKTAWRFIMYIHSNTFHSPKIWETPGRKLAISWSDLHTRTILIGFSPPVPLSLIAKQIMISHNKGMASNLTVSFDNKDGVLSPDKEGPFNKVFWPNNLISIRQGYGENLVDTFAGIIDNPSVRSFPQELVIGARDQLKKALDQTITSANGKHVIRFDNVLVEDIFTTLALLAGLDLRTIEPTGMKMSHTFSWESYMDAFSLLCDVANFVVNDTEEGKINFKYNTIRQPTHTQALDLTGEEWHEPDESPGVIDSEIVTDETGTIKYVKGTHYDFEYNPVQIKRLNLPDGHSVLVDYIYAAHVFREGVDIIRVGLDISDTGLYRTIIVHGQDSDNNVIEATKDYVDAELYNLPKDKILKIDAHEADTLAKCQAIADRAEYNIRSKARTIQFAAIAVPGLKVGDCVQVIESSGNISEAFVILDMATNMSDVGYTMDIRAFQMGRAPMPIVEEPEEPEGGEPD